MTTATQKLESIAVIGTGRVGGSLLEAAGDAGLHAVGLGREDLARASAEGTDAVVIAVPDREIEGVCSFLAEADRPVPVIGHTSGATGLSALATAASRGSATFVMHPLQTIASSRDSLAGAPCAVTSEDPAARVAVEALAGRLGMTPFHLPEEARVAYHAAATMASNFLIALEETATEMLSRAGVAGGRELLAPLVLRSAANWAEHGGDALTGPIARGDEGTVQRHREAISERFAEVVPVYEALADRTRAVAAGGGSR